MSGDHSIRQTTVGPAQERGPLVLKGCDYAAAPDELLLPPAAPLPLPEAPLPEAPLPEAPLPEIGRASCRERVYHPV